MSPRRCDRVRKLVVLTPSFDLSPRRKLSTACAVGGDATMLQPPVRDACCAADKLARRKGTAVLVASLIVTMRRCVSQPFTEPLTAACVSSWAAADQCGAFCGLPLASAG